MKPPSPQSSTRIRGGSASSLGAPGPEEALIETHAVGICHSDLGLIAGDIDNWMDVTYPVVFGHEWSGEVLAVGAEVTRVGVGDRVTG